MFYDKLKKLCDQNHTTPNAVCLELGLSNAVAPYWKKTGSTPKLATLQKIADFFGVGVNELIEEKTAETTEKPVIKPPAPSGMSENEKTILTVFKELTDTQQGELIGRAKMMAEQNAAENAEYVADENVS